MALVGVDVDKKSVVGHVASMKQCKYRLEAVNPYSRGGENGGWSQLPFSCRGLGCERPHLTL